MASPVAAVVVDHDTGPLLEGCVRSLLADGAGPVVVVENGEPGSAKSALSSLLSEPEGAALRLVQPGRNLGFGAGANRGLAALAGVEASEWVLISNADLVVHPGALDALRSALQDRPAWAMVGPRIYTDRFTKRYNPGTPDGEGMVDAGWISGSCFLARRSALEELGGFDEAYFMYAEDMDLCWRAHAAGWGVGFAGAASVTHIQGVSTARYPYKMMVAHHRSALRFTVRTTTGWQRLALPLAVLVLGLRMAMASVRLAVKR